jgi:hypothetical protein
MEFNARRMWRSRIFHADNYFVVGMEISKKHWTSADERKDYCLILEKTGIY